MLRRNSTNIPAVSELDPPSSSLDPDSLPSHTRIPRTFGLFFHHGPLPAPASIRSDRASFVPRAHPHPFEARNLLHDPNPVWTHHVTRNASWSHSAPLPGHAVHRYIHPLAFTPPLRKPATPLPISTVLPPRSVAGHGTQTTHWRVFPTPPFLYCRDPTTHVTHCMK